MARPPHVHRLMARSETCFWQSKHESALVTVLLQHSEAHGVIFSSAEARIEGWSSGAGYITGFTADDVIGQPLSMLFAPEDRERGIDEHELRIAREVGVAEDERWHVRKDGSRVWTTGVSMPLRDEVGALVGYIKIFRDATHLRSRIKYLENVLQECSFAQTQRDLFVGAIAHELRNPLTPLKTAVHLMELQRHDPDALQQSLKIMDRQISFLERLIEDLVDLTRLNVKKLNITYGKVVLQELIAEASEHARQRADHLVDIRLVMPSVPLEAEVDRERIGQVIENLVNNAVKFTPEGGVIWVTLNADQTHFLIFVRDTGIGIPPDMLPKVFDAFTQVGHMPTRRGAGVGIGLAVVKEIVSLHKGTVEVRSEGTGKGSEFIVRIPLREQHGAQPEPLPRPGSP